MILKFGQYKDQKIKDVSDHYLFYLCSRGRSTYYVSKHSLDIRWRVPFEVWEAARAEAERRGYTKIGERWEKNDR